MPNNIEMIKDLRSITQAAMKDCRDALEEAHWDLQKAIDIIKVKGKSIASNSKIASEGAVEIKKMDDCAVMVEINCVTDFVARMPEFSNFINLCLNSLHDTIKSDAVWSPSQVESQRQDLSSITKENIVVSHWWVQQSFKPQVKLFSYIHPNKKIGVILTLAASSEENANSQEFVELGDNLVLQIASMKPLVVSPDKLDPILLERQKAIFQTQIIGMNKPQSSHDKIMEGKLNKWYTDVCLIHQDYVVNNTGKKTSVKSIINSVSSKIGEVQVINFIRCEVGEGIEKPNENLLDETSKLLNG